MYEIDARFRNMGIFLSALSSGATLIAAAAAVASWRAAHTANKTSETLVGLERERRHSELIPEFRITQSPSNDNVNQLVIQLIGPSGLDRIDRLTVTVRDNKRMLASPTGSPSLNEVSNQIWGPYRFTPSVDDASADGRSVPYEQLKLGDVCIFQMERTLAPYWTDDFWWKGQFGLAPIKLTLFCEHNDYKSWTVPYEIVLFN